MVSCRQAMQRMAGADFRKGREEAVAVATILAAFAKAERSTLLGFPLREPATLPADAQAAEVRGSRLSDLSQPATSDGHHLLHGPAIRS